MTRSTVDIADLAAAKYLELHALTHYGGTVLLHGMAKRACLDDDSQRLDELKAMLAPFLAGERRFGNFESYHCGGNGTAWLLHQGRFPESADAVFRCADELFARHRRTPEGFLTIPVERPGRESNIIWIDAAFAVTPFLTYAGFHFDKPEWIEDGFFQIKGMYDLFFDPACGLLHQAKHVSGRGVMSQDHWSRGNGWAIIALSELVNALPEHSPLREPSVNMFKDLIRAALRVQDSDGMWHQEMTLHDSPSFVETSGTGMFLYALGVAIEKGVAEDGWREALMKGLRGYLTFIAFDGSVHHTCQGCCSPEDGSIAAYCRKEHPINDVHAHGPVVLAFAQARRIGIAEI